MFSFGHEIYGGKEVGNKCIKAETFPFRTCPDVNLKGFVWIHSFVLSAQQLHLKARWRESNALVADATSYHQIFQGISGGTWRVLVTWPCRQGASRLAPPSPWTAWAAPGSQALVTSGLEEVGVPTVFVGGAYVICCRCTWWKTNILGLNRIMEKSNEVHFGGKSTELQDGQHEQSLTKRSLIANSIVLGALLTIFFLVIKK